MPRRAGTPTPLPDNPTQPAQFKHSPPCVFDTRPHVYTKSSLAAYGLQLQSCKKEQKQNNTKEDGGKEHNLATNSVLAALSGALAAAQLALVGTKKSVGNRLLAPLSLRGKLFQGCLFGSN